MAELPEILKITKQMNDTLKNKTISRIELLQEKCSNVSSDDFNKTCIGAHIHRIENKGKWIITFLSNGYAILLSLGMGADVLYYENEESAASKYQVKMTFDDKSGYTVKFWWFGKFLLSAQNELPDEPNTKSIGINPFDRRFSEEHFIALLNGKKTQIKAFLLNQKNIGGIGNMYMHDILFLSNLHPQSKISSISKQDVKNLYKSILSVLKLSQSKDAFEHELDFFGNKGHYGMDDFLIGYKEKSPCPKCGEAIILIKTGSTSSFICPKCQKKM